ncbi:hypothetical protein [Mycobacteroides abscessus]|uniref:hypothetical protein n=1 Tax=Mycobacteroides abscessus TaxID=36809 RepID=UPI000927FD87|nr:hypothetical protein [Mycobacteroides abscessus]SIC59322.1 Uncharacterised protein [Mycobacteroides abscessus subsp. abscessus]
MERANADHNRLTDDELIAAHIAEVEADVEEHDSFGVISHAAARMIAAQYQSPADKGLAMLASTGRCDDETFTDVQRNLAHVEAEGDTEHAKWLRYLLIYIALRQYEETDGKPVEDWHKFWLHQPGGEL